MARATHLTIGTADRIRLDASGHGYDNENEVRQEVQVSITYLLDPGDIDLTAFAEEKAEEVRKAHGAAWNRIGAFRHNAYGNVIPGCTCQDQTGNDDKIDAEIDDEEDGPEDGLGGDPMPPGPPPASPTTGNYYLPEASSFRNGNGSPETDAGSDDDTGQEPVTGPQKILIRSRAKKAGLTAYALERLLHEQFKVWRIERLSKSQAASLLDALERDLKERDLKEKGNGSKVSPLAAGGDYAA